MVWVDPATGRKYAEESDYLTDEPVNMSALLGEFKVWYASDGTEVRAYATNPLGNSNPGTFVINGAGKSSGDPTRGRTPSQNGALIYETYPNSVAGAALLARVQLFLSSNFGAFAAAQFPALVNNTLITGLPGTIRIGESDWWGRGQAWQRVHPAHQRPSSDSVRVPAGTGALPPYSRLGWQWDFYRDGGAHPAWLRWRTFGRIPHAKTTATEWPLFSLESDGDVFAAADVPLDQTHAYVRVTTLDGEGFTTSSPATAALGLTSTTGGIRHFGSAKGISGMSAASLTVLGDAKHVGDLQNLTWNATQPFRFQLWTNSTESSLLTGTDWATSEYTHMWFDVEVYPPAAVGPEIPAGIEPLIADTLPRVTSRIRLRTGIDGGTP